MTMMTTTTATTAPGPPIDLSERRAALAVRLVSMTALPPLPEPAYSPDVRAAERAMLHKAILQYAVRLKGRPTYDFKELVTQSAFVRAAGKALWALVREFRPEVLIGPGFGGVPLLYATALAALDADGVDLAIWMVRDQRKTYHRKRWIEGPRFDHVPRAVMLDDFMGQGTSLQLVDEALASDGMQADLCGIGLLFDYWSPLGSRQTSLTRCPVASVFKRHDFNLTRDCHDAAPPLMKGSAPPLVAQPRWWRFDFNGASALPSKSSPAIADGAVFAADDQRRMWRFNALTGEAAWHRDSLGDHPKGIVQCLQPVDGSVVYGCYDGTVTRLDQRTGQIVWRWRVDAYVHATPAVDLENGRLYVNTESVDSNGACGHLNALDWKTGRTIWRRRQAFWPPGSPFFDKASQLVVATCNDQSLIAVDAATGALRWRATTHGLVRGRPAVIGDVVLVANESTWLQAFDLHTGAELRRRQFGGGDVHQYTHAADGLVYTVDSTGHLSAFDIEDFRLVWINRLRSTGTWAPVALGRHLIMLSREGHLVVLDAKSGIKHWEGEIDGQYRQPPAVGVVDGVPLLVCSSHRSGIGAHEIHPFYCEASSQ